MRVLRVIDIETTGMEPPAEVIEIGWQDVLIDDAGAKLGPAGSRLFGAERGIPPETSAVHHLTPRMLDGLPPLVAPHDLRVGGMPPYVLVAHNCAFEGQWFDEVARTTIDGAVIPLLCTLKAASRVWPEAPGHSNSVLRYWLGMELDPELAMPPHRAQPDAYVTAQILVRLLAEVSVEDMVAWTEEPRVMPRITFGKHRGSAWPDVPTDYLNWLVLKSEMDADAKWNAQRELDRRRGRRV